MTSQKLNESVINEENYDELLQTRLKELERIVEDFTQAPKPGSRPGSLNARQHNT